VVWGGGRNHPTHPTLLHRPIKLYDVETKHVLDNSRLGTDKEHILVSYHKVSQMI